MVSMRPQIDTVAVAITLSVIGTLLPGHGEPWSRGVSRAVAQAKARA